MLSLSALFAIMMAPALAVLMTSLIVRLFEQKWDASTDMYSAKLPKANLN